MAVAADFHRDFLIPEHTVKQACPTTNTVGVRMPCVYSFVRIIVSYFLKKFKTFLVFNSSFLK